MAKRDYYEVLGVSSSAEGAEIKSAYRKAAMAHHPDRNPGNKEAEEKFKEAAEAYSVLSDADKRARYDQFGHEGLGAGAQNFDPGAFSDFADILGDFFGMGDVFFGGGRRRSGPRPGRDLGYDLELDLEHAVFGTEQEIRTVRAEACGSCGGSGAATPEDLVTCPTCHGSGQQTLRQGFLSIARTCGACRGAGKAISNACDECSGGGRVRRELTHKVSVPAGVDHGTRLRIRGEGEAGEPGAPSGDLYVILHVREHAVFSRSGRHLVCELPISFSQAGLGGEVDVPLLGGGTASLRIPPGTQFGAQLSISGKGVNERGRLGDLVVHVRVRTPARLSDEGRKALKALAESGDEVFSEEDRSMFDKVKDFFS
jgi:molecular chaperone DnaJ